MVDMATLKKPKKNLHNSIVPDIITANNEENGESHHHIEEQEPEVPQEIQIIAQEVKIVKALACNDLSKRNKQMKKLRRWLQLRSQSSFPFSQQDFTRIWKGLYYNMWYSDKPLVQEELAEQLGKLLECFEGKVELSVNFFGAFLKAMCIEWFGIDQWRIDKFLMLARRMLRYMFKVLRASDWDAESVELFNKHATATVLFDNVTAKGLTMHYLDIFFEELAKVSEGEISLDQVALFVKPFVMFMATQRDIQLISHCRNRVFYHLLYQSALGREYSEKYNAWKDMGFPTKHIDDLEKCEESENEADNDGGDVANIVEEEVKDKVKYLDPRAGNVDVFMPVLPLDGKPVISYIEQFLYKNECATKRRKMLKGLLEIFKTFQNGEFPLGIKTMPRFEAKSERPLIKDKIKKLENLENELYGVDRKLKQLTKRKRRKLLKSLNYDDIDESNYEQKLEKAIPNDYLIERRKKSQKAFMSGWLEEELDENDLKAFVPSTNKGNGYAHEKENSTATNSRKNTKKQKLVVLEENQQEQDLGEPRKKHKKIEKSEKVDIKIVALEENKKTKGSIKPLLEVNASNQPLTPDEEETKQKRKEPKVLKISDDIVETPKSKLSSSKLSSVLKISDSDEQLTPKGKKTNPNSSTQQTDEWDQPLAEGEIEYFLPSRKLKLKKINSNLVLNPLAKNTLTDNQLTPIMSKRMSLATTYCSSTPPGSLKRVKIALKHNTSQNPAEYIQQIKSSPDIPYDAKKKPGKGLLKPNAMPSPINPFYKKKIGLKLLNDTI